MSDTQPPDEGEPSVYEALGRTIKVERTARGLGRRALAELAGISYPYLAEIENGTKRPSSRALLAIANALGMRAGELLGTAEEWVLPETDEDIRMQSWLARRPRAWASEKPSRPTRAQQIARAYEVARAPEPEVARAPEGPEVAMAAMRAEPEAARARPDQARARPEDARTELVQEIRLMLSRLSADDLRAVRDLLRRLAR